MSIFDARKLAAVLAMGIASASVLRCGLPETCLRMSDCSVGFACVASTCVPEALSSSDEAGPREGGTSGDGGANPRVADAASSASSEAGASDAGADAASTADAGPSDDAGTGGDSSDF